MKTYLFLALISIGFFTSCTPSQKIIASWYSPEVKAGDAYNSIFVIAITSDRENRYLVEAKVAKLLKERGKKVMMSTEKFPPSTFTSDSLTKEQFANIVRVSGCDAIFTLAAIDVKSETRYQPATTTYVPYGYGGYYGYYNYYSMQTYTPGYYVTEKTYFIESNFYDAKDDKMLWSIQSSAYNPTSFDSWFQKYSQVMFSELNSKGLVKRTK